MPVDAQDLARQLLSRHGAGGSSEAATIAGPKPGNGGVPRPEGRRSDLSDHPQVIAALEIRRKLTAFTERGLPSPLFLPHTGPSGATFGLLGQEMVNFSGYNYLGLAGDDRVIEAAADAARTYGTSASAARAVAGEIPLYGELERRFADAYEVDDALVTPSGFLTNAGIIPFILGQNDLAACDALVHSSIVSGTQWARCKRANFRHNDPDALDRLLMRSRSHFDRAMVIVEGVYSMDGDIVRLPEMIEVARRHDCLIMVDEAHSFGTLGERGFGTREHFDLPGDAVDLWMGTLSKTMASCGGYLAGSADLIWAIRMLGPGLCMFVAPPTPPQIGAAIAAFDIMVSEPERLGRLRESSAFALAAAKAAGWDTGESEGTAIVPIILGATERAVGASVELLGAGINASAIAYPAVPEGEARLRLFMSADHTTEHITRMMDALAEIVPT
ncbi:MAG: aminotransferase class I/II-fold pyridoxal phosphate-dependent enzyme [Actinomycetota bacterium]|nr:aminotransferase class I/II-fold pyridoxal phosphate-dependent enzyme [Actinomycetota bacterium]